MHWRVTSIQVSAGERKSGSCRCCSLACSFTVPLPRQAGFLCVVSWKIMTALQYMQFSLVGMVGVSNCWYIVLLDCYLLLFWLYLFVLSCPKEIGNDLIDNCPRTMTRSHRQSIISLSLISILNLSSEMFFVLRGCSTIIVTNHVSR